MIKEGQMQEIQKAESEDKNKFNKLTILLLNLLHNLP